MSESLKTAWLAETAARSLQEEAGLLYPLETGGALLGYIASSEYVITGIIGPGPKAVHTKCGFVPDYDYHDRCIAEVYEKSGRKTVYLGDWHTHPGGPAVLSRRDRRTLARIATAPEARIPFPLMMIIAGGRTDWLVRVWRALATVRFGCKILKTEPVVITRY